MIDLTPAYSTVRQALADNGFAGTNFCIAVEIWNRGNGPDVNYALSVAMSGFDARCQGPVLDDAVTAAVAMIARAKPVPELPPDPGQLQVLTP